MSSNLVPINPPNDVDRSSDSWLRAVEDQLQRMLASIEFQRASRPARFLEYVVRHMTSKPGEPLPEAEIAEAVYDRRNFDARLDPIVRVEAARLRKRIQSYYQNQGANDPIAIVLPQRGYAPEITPRAPNGPRPVPAQETGPGDGQLMQLAVLPFADLSENAHLAGFCSGLTEEIIASVTALTGISVVSRTSAALYEGGPVDLRSVGKDLGVTHALEGSVRQGDKQLRVTAKLIDCSNGFTVWSKSLETDASGDPLVAQETLAGLIAETLAEKARQATEPAAAETSESSSQ